MDQPNNETQDIGSLFEQATDDQLVDSLLAEGDEPERHEQPRQPRQAPQPRVSGYDPLIKAKRAKIAELSKRLQSFDQENSPYVSEGPNGERQYNHAMFQREQFQLNEMREELRELERKRDESERSGSKNSEVAYKLARKLIEREVAKLPKNMHQPVVQVFGQLYTHFADRGEWGKAEYADPARLRDALVEVLDNAVGRVARQQAGASPNPAGPSQGGEDLEPGDSHGSQGESEELDDFTNNMLYAYEQRRENRGKSIGQIRREQRDAARVQANKGGER